MRVTKKEALEALEPLIPEEEAHEPEIPTVKPARKRGPNKDAKRRREKLRLRELLQKEYEDLTDKEKDLVREKGVRTTVPPEVGEDVNELHDADEAEG